MYFLTDFKNEEDYRFDPWVFIYFFYVCSRITSQHMDRFWWAFFYSKEGYGGPILHCINIGSIFCQVLVNNKDYCHLIIIILYTYAHIYSACLCQYI